MGMMKPRTNATALLRTLFALTGALVLAGCMTTKSAGPYSARQIAVLQEQGFTRNGDDWQLGIDDKLLFPTNENTLASEQRDRIARLSGSLLAVGVNGAEIQGHADSTGSMQYNKVLSEQRAEAVRLAMVQGGMAADRLKAVGYGEARPIESNGTAAGRRENRRVVVLVTPADVMKL